MFTVCYQKVIAAQNTNFLTTTLQYDTKINATRVQKLTDSHLSHSSVYCIKTNGKLSSKNNKENQYT